MKIREFKAEAWLGASLEEVFEFFSDARNLQLLTPPWVHFKIISSTPIEMRPGALIDYQIKIRGIPVRWRTRITEWQPPFRFVDEQLRGPYHQWIHEHTFEESGGGVIARDFVKYSTPFDWLVGRWVQRDVERIFAYRAKALKERFG